MNFESWIKWILNQMELRISSIKSPGGGGGGGL